MHQAISRETIRSSVRPKSSKQPWGTIIHPEFGLGHQRLTAYEVEQTVDRLYYIPMKEEPPTIRVNNKKMSKKEINAMLKRLTSSSSVPDSDRRQTSSIYSGMGVVNSYAWKGYNY